MLLFGDSLEMTRKNEVIYMSDLVQFICGEATSFEPCVLVGLIVFVIIFDGISFMVGSVIGAIRR